SSAQIPPNLATNPQVSEPGRPTGRNRSPSQVSAGDGVLDELEDYMEEFPPVAVTLPWEKPGGRLVTVRLLMTTPDRNACDDRSTTWVCGVRRSRGLA
ncbi:hypothetical protein LX90_009261, partial [Lentzea flava]|nr:hypothetical protein [Lentzea flava]